MMASLGNFKTHGGNSEASENSGTHNFGTLNFWKCAKIGVFYLLPCTNDFFFLTHHPLPYSPGSKAEGFGELCLKIFTFSHNVFYHVESRNHHFR